jgi:hypothetical protein
MSSKMGRLPLSCCRTKLLFLNNERVWELRKNSNKNMWPLKDFRETRRRCLMLVILNTQEAEIRRITVRSQHGQKVHETLSQKILHKKGLMEWFKAKALSSSPSTAKKKKKKKDFQGNNKYFLL